MEDYRSFPARRTASWLQLKSACLREERVTCAVKPEGEQDIIAGKASIPSVEVTFSHGKGVSEVESAVHVGVGEGFEVFRFFVGFGREILIPFPNVPGPIFKRDKFVSAGGVLHLLI